MALLPEQSCTYWLSFTHENGQSKMCSQNRLKWMSGWCKLNTENFDDRQSLSCRPASTGRFSSGEEIGLILSVSVRLFDVPFGWNVTSPPWHTFSCQKSPRNWLNNAGQWAVSARLSLAIRRGVRKIDRIMTFSQLSLQHNSVGSLILSIHFC